MDSVIVYTADGERFWRALAAAATQRGAVLHRSPPEVAIEVDDARLYVTEGPPDEDVPPLAAGLGAALREVVVDIHNPPVAQAFLADVLSGLDVVVDDDHGQVMSGAEFVDRVRGRSGAQGADRRQSPPS